MGAAQLHGHPGRALLFEHSTNLTHLANDPVSVLVTSAAWLTRRELLAWLVLFPLVLAPAERWLGTLRTIVVFAIGHVGATLVTAAGIAYGIDHGLLPDHLRNVVDVGSSYGFLCVAALFTYRLPGRWRWLWAGTLLGGALAVAAVDSSFSDYGHLVAVVIGLSLYAVTRTPAEQIRSRWPIWRPPEELVEAERERYAARDRLQHGR